ncbi:MAG: hypothetical protein H6744_00555 [Deltaproteobacteria bacterium]|nr:hypothetical protein [Deltaproteobacteria bacterium]MCB9785156.1 hypothetical protein [Deltaproteobacteria bacterium]
MCAEPRVQSPLEITASLPQARSTDGAQSRWGPDQLDSVGQRLAVLHAVLVEHVDAQGVGIPAHARRRLSAEAARLDRLMETIDTLISEARHDPVGDRTG